MTEAAKEEKEKPDVDAAVQEAIDKLFASSNWRSRVQETVRDAFKSREANRTLKLKVVDLEKQVADLTPKDGSMILAKEDAEVYTAFKALSKTPAELKTIVTEHGTLATKEKERAEESAFAEAAESLGYQNVPAVKRMLTREGLVLEFKEVRAKDENDKTVVTRVPYVRPKADDKAALEPLEEYLEREVPEFIPIFTAAPEVRDDAEVEEDPERLAPAPRRMSRTESTTRNGTIIAATRGARDGATSTKDAKRLQDEEDAQRASGAYSL